MIRRIVSAVSAGPLAACLILPAGGQECSQCSKPLWDCASIFVVEIEAVGDNYKPDASPEGVRVRITRILNDGYHKGLQLGSLDVNLRRHAPTDDSESYHWAQQELRVGKQ